MRVTAFWRSGEGTQLLDDEGRSQEGYDQDFSLHYCYEAIQFIHFGVGRASGDDGSLTFFDELFRKPSKQQNSQKYT